MTTVGIHQVASVTAGRLVSDTALGSEFFYRTIMVETKDGLVELTLYSSDPQALQIQEQQQ
jgi:hypothetical protein